MSFVVPAVLPASKKELAEKLALLTSLPSIDRIQIDVVDGQFASPASWPYSIENWKLEIENWEGMLPRLGAVEYEVDIMCIDAEAAAAAWLALGASRLTIHAESPIDLPRLLGSLSERFGEAGGFSIGLAINLASSLALIEPFFAEATKDKPCIRCVQYVQCMGIARIGRQGQPFDERVFEKIRVLREKYPRLPIQVDGGVSLHNAKRLIAAGVSNLVVGSSILRAADPAKAIAEFEALYIAQYPYGV
ncbi:hypothetical protein HYV30_04190 [Candidatus Kaiserbacteria bacterium]|nr:hypothetical protein [Candidatus Kaiserbacteria bacterium]